MSLTAASTTAEKVRNITVAVIGTLTLLGMLFIPISYYAHAEVKTFVDDYFSKKYEVGLKGLQQRQRSFSLKLDKNIYESKKDREYWEKRFNKIEERQNYTNDKQLKLLEDLNKKLDKR